MYKFIRPLLFKLDPELAHNSAHNLLKLCQSVPPFLSIIKGLYNYPSSRFIQKIWDMEFVNPIGLAAGFDKNAEIADGMAALGFGFLELGSVTNNKSDGNVKPRMFRLIEDKALINRMGLNNKGPYQFLSNYSSSKTNIPKFVNIAKTHDSSIIGDLAIKDMIDSYKVLGEKAKGIVFNLSCPNTEDGRTFEDPELLVVLLDEIVKLSSDKSYNHPILLKFSNDVSLEILEKLILLSLSKGISGFVIGNTSVSRDNLNTSSETLDEIGKGGLSGAPIFLRALERVKFVHDISRGAVPIIGVGGIDSASGVIKMMEAGASLVELYSSLVYEGPAVVSKILEDLEAYLIKNSLLSISEIRPKN